MTFDIDALTSYLENQYKEPLYFFRNKYKLHYQTGARFYCFRFE